MSAGIGKHHKNMSGDRTTTLALGCSSPFPSEAGFFCCAALCVAGLQVAGESHDSGSHLAVGILG